MLNHWSNTMIFPLLLIHKHTKTWTYVCVYYLVCKIFWILWHIDPSFLKKSIFFCVIILNEIDSIFCWCFKLYRYQYENIHTIIQWDSTPLLLVFLFFFVVVVDIIDVFTIFWSNLFCMNHIFVSKSTLSMHFSFSFAYILFRSALFSPKCVRPPLYSNFFFHLVLQLCFLHFFFLEFIFCCFIILCLYWIWLQGDWMQLSSM